MITPEQQQQDNWCWVACFRMACSSFGAPAPDQCTIAGQFLGINGCCPAGSNPACDKTLPEASIPNLYSSGALVALSIPVGDASFQLALSNASLVLLLLAFPLTYHFVLLATYDAAQAAYATYDPKYAAPFPASFAELSSAYQTGGSIAQAWRITSR